MALLDDELLLELDETLLLTLLTLEDELDSLEDAQSETSPPFPDWLVHVLTAMQLALSSQPQPLCVVSQVG